MINITGRITKRLDGSYLIDQGYGPNTYHAHAEATPEAYQAADEYAKDNPDMVDHEQAPDPAEMERQQAEAATESERAAILGRLAQIDTETIRPMRAALSGTATLYDTDKLAELEQEADKLRAELSIGGEP
jgi:hypothetical protein